MSTLNQFMSQGRRDFLRRSVKGGAGIALASAFPPRLLSALGSTSPYNKVTGAESSRYLADPELMRRLVHAAVDTARSAGARYVEARVTRFVSQGFRGKEVGYDAEELAIGVRALVNGGWGFASSSYWDIDDANALAREAVEQAKINSSIFPVEVDLGSYPVAKGTWVTPIRIDPFQISLEEKGDYSASFRGVVPQHERGWIYSAGIEEMGFQRQERMVATSDNSLFAQTLYDTFGVFSVAATHNTQWKKVFGRGLALAGAGWELVLDAKLHDQIPELIEELKERFSRPPAKPIDVGRYEVVMSADVVASFIGSSLGNATQIDRAIGMEANAGGTSYLGPDPADHLGSTLGASILNVSGNRSQPKGLATVKWDDEGVEPETFPLIENGKLVDYQTTREQSAWLKLWYESRQRSVRSHGCAVAPSADQFPMQHTPNLEMKADPGKATFADMIKNTERGIAFSSGFAKTDFQSRSGAAAGELREIINGKLGPELSGASILFDSKEFWKNLTEIGGESSRTVTPYDSTKGQPGQSTNCSISAVASRFKEVTVIDAKRK